MSSRFVEDPASIDNHGLSPFVLHSAFKSAIILKSGVGKIERSNREQAISSLKAMLHCASRRWRIGSMRKCPRKQCITVRLTNSRALFAAVD